MRWINLEQMNKIIEEQDPVIVDLRTPAEYQRGHIPGSINIPIELFLGAGFPLDAYKDRTILLYCRTVNKTKLALRLLDNRGFESTYALLGGYEDYRMLYER